MKYSANLVKKWNQPYMEHEANIVHGFPNILWGVVTESGAQMFNVVPDSEVALIYEAGDWLFIGKTFSQKEIVAAFTSGKFFAESVAAYVLVEDVLRWIQEVGANEWGALALSKMYGICHEHGMANILCAMYVIKRYSNSACIDKAIKSIVWSNDDAGDADENVLHWVNKIVHYTFTCQF